MFGCVCVSASEGLAIAVWGYAVREPFTAADFDRPFGCPPDAPKPRAPIVLDLPVPQSVNKTRRVHWASMAAKTAWLHTSDMLVMAIRPKPLSIIGPWEMVITMSDKLWLIDPDNGIKDIIDFCRRIDLIENDSPKFARRIVLEWGEAPEGCRVTIRPAG